MEISPPTTLGPIPTVQPPQTKTTLIAPVIGQLAPNTQMSAAQQSRIEEVLQEYRQQERNALKELHEMRQKNRAAEVALQIEQAKLCEAELQAQHSSNKVSALTRRISLMLSWSGSSSIYTSQPKARF